MENNIFVFEDKYKLASYVSSLFFDAYDHEISPIKLQKSMYFLYAYWLEKINSMGMESQHSEDCDNSILSDKLFNAKFKAWKYGPVEVDIYSKYKYSTLERMNKIEISKFKASTPLIVTSYVDELVSELFEMNDFALVDISHQDSAWSNIYDPKTSLNDNLITHESICRDYVK